MGSIKCEICDQNFINQISLDKHLQTNKHKNNKKLKNLLGDINKLKVNKEDISKELEDANQEIIKLKEQLSKNNVNLLKIKELENTCNNLKNEKSNLEEELKNTSNKLVEYNSIINKIDLVLNEINVIKDINIKPHYLSIILYGLSVGGYFLLGYSKKN